MIALDSFLLLILIIITVVCLFLCILNALFLFDIRNRSRTRETRPYTPSVMMPEPGPGPGSEQSHDLGSGIRLTAGKYHLDSLVIGTADGLVVTSYGSRNPEYEAAYYSNIIDAGTPAPGDGVKLFTLDFRATPLIVIARARTTPPEEMIPKLEADIRTVFETHL